MKNGTAVRNRNKLVRSGQVWSYQARSDQVRSGQDKSALFESCETLETEYYIFDG